MWNPRTMYMIQYYSLNEHDYYDQSIKAINGCGRADFCP